MLDAQVVKPVQSAASRRIQRLKSLNEGHQPSCQRTARRHRGLGQDQNPSTTLTSAASGHRISARRAVNRSRPGFFRRFRPGTSSGIMVVPTVANLLTCSEFTQR